MNSTYRYKATRLAATLEDRGIKQRWLADQLGIHESIVSDWVKGRRTLGDTRAKEVADVLGIPFFLLFDVPNVTDSVTQEAA